MPNTSEKAFDNLLREVSEAAKFLVNRHAKLVAMNIIAARKEQSEAAAIDKGAEDARLADINVTDNIFVDYVDADMADTPNAEASSNTTDASVDDENEEAHDVEVQVHVFSEAVAGARPTFDESPPSGCHEEGVKLRPEGLKEDFCSPEKPGISGRPQLLNSRRTPRRWRRRRQRHAGIRRRHLRGHLGYNEDDARLSQDL